MWVGSRSCQAAGDRFDELELSILVAEVFTTEERESAFPM